MNDAGNAKTQANQCVAREVKGSFHRVWESKTNANAQGFFFPEAVRLGAGAETVVVGRISESPS